MLLQAITAGVRSIQEKEIETAVHKLVFDIYSANPTGYSATAPLTSLEAICADAHLTLVLQTPDGTRTLMNKMPLKHVAQLNNFNEGAIRMDTVSGTNRRCLFTVDISTGGAVQFGSGAKLLVTLDNLPDGTNSFTTAQVYAISHPVRSDAVIAYETTKVYSGLEQSISVYDHDRIAIPAASVTQLEFVYVEGGKRITLKGEELEAVQNDMARGVVRMEGNVYFNSEMGLYQFGCAHLRDIVITTSADANVYRIKERRYAGEV